MADAASVRTDASSVGHEGDFLSFETCHMFRRRNDRIKQGGIQSKILMWRVASADVGCHGYKYHEFTVIAGEKQRVQVVRAVDRAAVAHLRPEPDRQVEDG